MDLGFALKAGQNFGFWGPMRIIQVALLATCLVSAGCKEEQPVPPPPVAAAPAAGLPPAAVTGTPQPKLPTVKLWVGTNEIAAEIASTLPQIQTGMMWRTNMAEMEGMLFVFPRAQSVAFYMRNTLLPLSCAYLDPAGTILEIYDMQPRDETPLPSESSEVQYVLEMNQGWFHRHNVRPGMLLTTQYGPLPQAFSRPRR
jgi:uncharacterized membrane protein (UPF0127 family)